jgi:hypothetical protein
LITSLASPPVLGGIERDRRVAQARTTGGVGLGGGLGGERQAAQLALDLVLVGCIERAVPVQREVADDALRVQLAEQLAHSSAERHPRGHLRHQPEVQALGAELAAGCGFALGLMPGQAHVAARPADAVAGDETELFGRDGQPLGVALGGEAAFDLLQRDRLDVVCQAQRDLAQRQVERHALRLAFFTSSQARSAPSPWLRSKGRLTWRRSWLTSARGRLA